LTSFFFLLRLACALALVVGALDVAGTQATI
jgi:hypothetical protein